MPSAPIPANEAERIAALQDYEILDSACETTLDDIAKLAAKLAGCPIGLISLVDTDRQWFKARHGVPVEQTSRDLAFCAHAILDPSQALIVPDATKDTRFADNALVTDDPNIRFYVGIPLVNPQGYALGTLCTLGQTPREIDPELLATLRVLASAVMMNFELRRAMRQIQNMALTDPLTGLPNRTALHTALRQAVSRQRRDGQCFSLLYIDLDHFKSINDQFGHSAGDEVLKITADVIRAAVRCEDTAARIGGDEFAAVLVGGDGSEATLAGERIRLAIQDRLAQGGRHVTASVGAVTFPCAPVSEADALAAADGMMYTAKVRGKNRVSYREMSSGDQVAGAAAQVAS